MASRILVTWLGDRDRHDTGRSHPERPARIDAVVRGVVAVRPPGHHATGERGQGFCLLNNIAVGAAALAERGARVLIVDWDVHHGNGTQEIFYDDPRVLYVSTHQSPAYPGTGSASETGGTHAPGLTINFPFPPGATCDVALAAVDEVVAPAVEQFAPDWVLVSAGFDAHRDDPLADHVDTEPPTAGGPGRATVDLVARVREQQLLADS